MGPKAMKCWSYRLDWWSLVIMFMKLLISIKDEELFDQLSFSRSAVFMDLVVCGVTIPGFFFLISGHALPSK